MTIKDSNGDSTIFEYDDFLKLKHQKNNNGVYLTGNDYYFSRKDNGDVYNPSDPNFIRSSSYLNEDYSNFATSAGWTYTGGVTSIMHRGKNNSQNGYQRADLQGSQF